MCPPWRDRSWTMPRGEKPGLGQGEILSTTSYSEQIIRFLPEPALSEDTKIPRFARNDRGEGVEMTEKGEGVNYYSVSKRYRMPDARYEIPV
jgi:hypothetical protein